MSPPSVIVCGCTKNSANYIQSHLEKLYSLQSIYPRFQMVIFENDSTDNTKAILKQFETSHDNVHMLFDTLNGKIKTPVTIKPYSRYVQKPLNLSYTRNVLLDYVETHFSHFDYMMMVDLDSVVKNFEVSIIQHTMNKYVSSSWDALTANSTGKYYDIWALRINTEIWNSELHGKLWREPIDYDCWMKKDTQKSVRGNQINIPRDFPLIPVTSAFGGMGIYRISSIKGCRYSAEFDQSLTCEHVYFHDRIIKRGGKIFICPDMIVQSQC